MKPIYSAVDSRNIALIFLHVRNHHHKCPNNHIRNQGDFRTKKKTSFRNTKLKVCSLKFKWRKHNELTSVVENANKDRILFKYKERVLSFAMEEMIQTIILYRVFNKH
jgi:hypothetical protein